MNIRRPYGVTVLAILHYVFSIWALALGVMCLLGHKAMVAADNMFYSGDVADAGTYSLRFRLLAAFACGLISALFFLLATGFWRLKNWARVTIIGLLLLGLAFGVGPLPPSLLRPGYEAADRFCQSP